MKPPRSPPRNTKSGTWTRHIEPAGTVSLQYFFTSFSNRRQHGAAAFFEDGDEVKLESDLRSAIEDLHIHVKKKKRMF